MEVEREEGEITDEEFENVSDSSISLNSLLLEELSSVSSDSDSDEVSIVEIKDGKTESVQKLPQNSKRPKVDETYSHKRVKFSKDQYRSIKSRHHRRSDGSYDSSSDSEDYIYNRRLLTQLQNAVCISSTKKNPNCSLRTRIKRMIGPDSPNADKSEEEDLESLRDRALKTKTASPTTVQNEENGENQPTVTDEDLFNLRLVALQSAVLKKHANRQKRKEQQNIEPPDIVKPPSNSEETEPPTTEVDSNVNTKNSDVQIVNTDAVPESGLTNNVVEQTPLKVEESIKKPAEKSSIEEDEDILRAMLLTSISRKIANKKNGSPFNNKLKITKVNQKITNHIKPLPPTNPIKRIIINVNSDSESDTNNDSTSPEKKVAPKKETINFENDLTNLLKEARKKSEAQKAQQQSDVSKHLTKSQQIEYRKLKRKLQLLSKQNLLLKYKKVNIDENKLVKGNILDNKPASIKKPFSNKFDRMHMKGKYESLAPLMNKIAKAREARDVAQNDVTRLINELKEARTRLTTTHKMYTTLIKQLQQVKAGIDERGNILSSRENKIIKKVTNSVPIVCTSTPLKENNKDNVCDISSIWGDKINITEESKIEKEVVPVVPNIPAVPSIPTEEIVETKPEADKMDVIDVQEDKDKEEPIFFPDVIEDSKKNNKPSDDIIKYNSPLEHIQTNSEEYGGNPLSVLCPYDLLGVCRDPDCGYRH